MVQVHLMGVLVLASSLQPTMLHVSNLTVPNLPVSPFPSYNMPTSPYPYYSSQSFGIGGAVPVPMFPSTPPPSLPVPTPQSGPTGVNLSALSNPVFQPTYPLSPSLPADNTVIVCFKFGNVSVCSGCRCNFGQNDEIVIKHPEFRSYNSPVTGHPTSKFGNAYYHIKMRCLKLKWPGVKVEDIVVPEEVATQLKDTHKSLLCQEFSLQLP